MNFEELLAKCAAKAYPEPRSPIHDQVGNLAVQFVAGILKPGSLILDVGCGSAFCSEAFRELGHQPVALSILSEEVKSARARGLEAHCVEMHDVGSLERYFDLIWLRHVAEHSPCPLLLLENCREVCNVGGLLYLEVPLPWTAAVHEANPDHFSVLNQISWENLLRRSGWLPIHQNSWPLITGAGPDCYYSFVCRKQ